MLTVLSLLFLKHFIIDFVLQTPYQLNNKGTYLHPGGLLHAGLHGVGTFLCFLLMAPVAAIFLALIDAVVHYHVDWAKVKLNNRYGWTTNNAHFWNALGADQLLHALTYIALIGMVI